MTEARAERGSAVTDPILAPFWEAAGRGELLIQRCGTCGAHQFYPRLFCLACLGTDVAWARASGSGTIYTLTTVRMKLVPELDPPYQVALVTLDEGPRFLGTLEGTGYRIGDRVTVAWRDRDEAPPLPTFRRAGAQI